MSSQAEGLQQLMAFFAVSERFTAAHRLEAAPPAAALAQRSSATPPEHGIPRQRANGSHGAGGGFRKF
jgi:hypothetical protein